MAAFAVGTDTGGSVREPAAQCGVVGMAPSPGLVPLDGVVPFAPDFDRVGPLAWSVADTAAVLAVMAGRRLVPSGTHAVRVGVVDELGGPGQPSRRPGPLHRCRSTGSPLAASRSPPSRYPTRTRRSAPT